MIYLFSEAENSQGYIMQKVLEEATFGKCEPWNMSRKNIRATWLWLSVIVMLSSHILWGSVSLYLVFIYKGHVSELMTIIESIYREEEVGEIDTLPEDDRVREPLNATFDNPGKDVWNGDSFKT